MQPRIDNNGEKTLHTQHLLSEQRPFSRDVTLFLKNRPKFPDSQYNGSMSERWCLNFCIVKQSSFYVMPAICDISFLMQSIYIYIYIAYNFRSSYRKKSRWFSYWLFPFVNMLTSVLEYYRCGWYHIMIFYLKKLVWLLKELTFATLKDRVCYTVLQAKIDRNLTYRIPSNH